MSSAVEAINAAYLCVANFEAQAHPVSSNLVVNFCDLHGRVRKAADENSDDYDIVSWERASGRLRFRLLSTPLPLNHSALLSEAEKDQLLRAAELCGSIYSELSPVSDRFLEAVEGIRNSDDNPLWRASKRALAAGELTGAALLIKAKRLAQALQRFADQENWGVSVVTETQLRHDSFFPRIVLFGAWRWYPGYVFEAPKAPKLDLFRYDFMSDGPPETAAFVKSMQGGARPRIGATSPSRPPLLASDDALQKVNVKDALQRVASWAGSESDDELMPVCAVLLEEGRAAFVSAEPGAKELVIDLEGEGETEVRRVPVEEIEPGVAILVRSEGGGDYVVAAADRILRADAQPLREAQRAWKRKLREFVDTVGLYRATKKLVAAGSKIANEQNLRNWMSARQIRTQNFSDFLAIFTVMGDANNSRTVWEQMERLVSAHRRAGFLIRKQLLEQVSSADLTPLLRDGKQDFSLPGDVGGGTITAYRVVDVSQDTFEMPSSALHRVVELEA